MTIRAYIRQEGHPPIASIAIETNRSQPALYCSPKMAKALSKQLKVLGYRVNLSLYPKGLWAAREETKEDKERTKILRQAYCQARS